MTIRPVILLPALLLLSLCLMLISLLTGSVGTGWQDLFAVLTGDGDALATQVILELRWPRTAAAFTTGALLALAGALMQVLLRNPLADPYVLGVSGGAASAALLAMLLGAGSAWLHGAAFGGALFSMLLVFGLSHGSGSWTSNRLLLTGVVVAAGWGAVIGFLLALGPDQGLRGMLFWLMGDLSYATLPVAGVAALITGLLASLGIGRQLNILTHGEQAASELSDRHADLGRRAVRRAVMLAGDLGAVAAAALEAGDRREEAEVDVHRLECLGGRT